MGVTADEDKSRRPDLGQWVLVVSCNFAYRDLLENWRCMAQSHGLSFVVHAMDAKLVASLEGYSSWNVIFDTSVSSQSIDPEKASAWRQGQFNVVTAWKVAAVRAILGKGYHAVFCDVDVVLFRDPVPYLFPESRDRGGSASTVATAVYDFAFQQNICGWKKGYRKAFTAATEGNTGFYYVKSSAETMRLFDAVIDKCRTESRVDDQTNFFDVLRKQWLGKQRAVLCRTKETQGGGLHAGAHAPSPSALRVCPLPRLQFASGYALHEGGTPWRDTLKSQGVDGVLLHFNCLGRGHGHDAKLDRIKTFGAWAVTNFTTAGGGAGAGDSGELSGCIALSGPASLGPALPQTAPVEPLMMPQRRQLSSSDEDHIDACFEAQDEAFRPLPLKPLPDKHMEVHYLELLRVTAPFRGRPPHRHLGSGNEFAGPWIENHWIETFCCDRPLSDFHGLVPLFVQWTDLFVSMIRKPKRFRFKGYPPELHKVLSKVLNPNLRCEFCPPLLSCSRC